MVPQRPFMNSLSFPKSIVIDYILLTTTTSTILFVDPVKTRVALGTYWLKKARCSVPTSALSCGYLMLICMIFKIQIPIPSFLPG